MSSFPCHPAASFSPAILQDFATKRAHVLKHVMLSASLAEVHPASRLAARPRPEMLSSGIPQLDALTGGIPRGCLSEVYGSASSGKTSVLLATLAAATNRDEACVLIDASDSFDPASAQAAGVELRKILWVRCGAARPSSTVKDFKNFPYSRRKQAQSERQSEHKLAQVLKTTDLILQSGGFGLVVLDLAGISEEFVRRIPLASWFRFQRAVEHSKTALLVVSEIRCAENCAALIFKSGNQLSSISFQPSERPAHAQLLECMQVHVEVVRSKLDRKPMQSAHAGFTTRAAHVG